MPYSRLKFQLASLLKDQGYLGQVEAQDNNKTLHITLRYHNETPLLTHIARISKPSLRRYAKSDSIPQSLSGRGVTVLTTSKGLMTDTEAKKTGIGGEIICQVW